ncbi:MAG: ankyrin repeat domain-containing protein [Herbinix sp.]|nr:ankyrin repeat domain-containing protein [Herbinix sp.]
MGKKSILAILVFLISILLTACSLKNVANSVTNNVGKALVIESDAKLNSGIESGNLERVREAIEDGANLNKIKVSYVSYENPVMIALMKNQDKIAKYLIENGADVNYADSSGRSLLMYSAYITDISFCEFLIKNGAKVGKEDKNGYTALDYVLKHSKKDTNENDIDSIITILLKNGAKVRPITLKAAMNGSYTDNENRYGLVNRVTVELIKEGYKTEINKGLEAAIVGASDKVRNLIKEDQIQKEDEQKILFYTAAFGEVETMKLLVNKGDDLKSCDDYKNTTLIVAAQYGNLEMVKYLLNIGIDIEAKNKDDYTALILATNNGQYDIVEYLVKQGALMRYKLPDRDFYREALDFAAENADIRIMNLLIDNGYPLNNDTLGSAMDSALYNNKIESIKYLLNKGMDPNIIFNEDTALDIACTRGNIEIAKILVESGANVNGSNVSGMPLLSAAKYGNIELVKYMLECGVDVNSVLRYDDGSGGESALMEAAYGGEYDVVKLLVESGAVVNYQDENCDSDTAIIWAASGGSRNILEYLIKRGGDFDYQNSNGETALMKAIPMGYIDCVKVLLKHEANITLKNKEGKTALDIAEAGGYNDIINLLKK